MGKRVLNVGHCSADGAAIKSFLKQHFDVDIVSAATADEAMSSLHNSPFDLVLINRVFDADGESGLDLLQDIKNHAGLSKVPVILISNLPEAQKKALDRGAAPGFGKQDLGTPKAMDRLAEILAEDDSDTTDS